MEDAMKKSLAIIIPAVALETVSLTRWLLACKDFTGQMHLTTAQLAEYLTRDIHNEQHVPIILVRLFFNKLIAGVFWGLKPYLTFFDLPFLVTLLSVVGCVGFILGAWFLVQKNTRKRFYSIISVLLLLPLLEVFGHDKLPFLVRFLLLALPFAGLSLFGIVMLVRTNKSSLPFVLLVIACLLSLLFLVAFPTAYGSYCVQY